MAIKFWRTREQYGGFSNFSPHAVDLDGKRWPTSEHYYQAQKFAGTPHEEAVRNASSPKEAATIGRARTLPLREDWEQVKDDVMRRAVLQKFTQHQELHDLLLSTGDEEIVEDSPYDYYWGCGAEGTGKNMLGKILMEVRSTLRGEEMEEIDINELEERAYIRGQRATWLGLLQTCIRELGYNGDEVEQSRWIIEREQTVAALRDVCEDFGDNDWDEHLHLADVVEKHLYRNLCAEYK